MSPTATLELTQGATRSIVASGIVDAAGDPLDVTGWTVRAQVRHTVHDAALLAEWVSGSPSDSQGRATTAGSVIILDVPAAMSDPWTWTAAILHIEITEPTPPGREERIADVRLTLDPSAHPPRTRAGTWTATLARTRHASRANIRSVIRVRAGRGVPSDSHHPRPGGMSRGRDRCRRGEPST